MSQRQWDALRTLLIKRAETLAKMWLEIQPKSMDPTTTLLLQALQSRITTIAEAEQICRGIMANVSRKVIS